MIVTMSFLLGEIKHLDFALFFIILIVHYNLTSLISLIPFFPFTLDHEKTVVSAISILHVDAYTAGHS